MLGLSFFFFSLAAFSVKSGALAYLLLVMCISRNLYSLKSYNLSLRTVTCLSLLLFYITAHTLFSEEIRFLYFFKFILLFFYCTLLGLLYSLRPFNIASLDKAVSIYLFIHTSIFFFQIAAYLLTGEYIDFHNMIGEDRAYTLYMSRDVVDLLIPIRATGFFSEPSFYSMAVLPFAAYLIYRSKQFRLSAVAISTCFLSLSAASIIITLFWIATLLAKPGGRANWALLPVLAVLVFVAGSIAYKRVFESEDYDALGSRMRIVNEIMLRPSHLNLTGAGYFYDEHGVNGYTNISPAAIRDSGVYFMLLYSGGVLAIFIFLLVLYLWLGFNYILMGVLVLFLFKYGILSSVLWLLLSVFFIARHDLGKQGVVVKKGLSDEK